MTNDWWCCFYCNFFLFTTVLNVSCPNLMFVPHHFHGVIVEITLCNTSNWSWCCAAAEPLLGSLLSAQVEGVTEQCVVIPQKRFLFFMLLLSCFIFVDSTLSLFSLLYKATWQRWLPRLTSWFRKQNLKLYFLNQIKETWWASTMRL